MLLFAFCLSACFVSPKFSSLVQVRKNEGFRDGSPSQGTVLGWEWEEMRPQELTPAFLAL